MYMGKRLKSKCVMGCRHFKHSFCAVDNATREVWRELLNIPCLLKTNRVCVNHFSDVMFRNSKKNRLTRTAVPDINLTTYLKTEGDENEGNENEVNENEGDENEGDENEGDENVCYHVIEIKEEIPENKGDGIKEEIPDTKETLHSQEIPKNGGDDIQEIKEEIQDTQEFKYTPAPTQEIPEMTEPVRKKIKKPRLEQ